MKYIYSLVVVFLFSYGSVNAQNLSVDFTVTNDGSDTKLVEVKFCAAQDYAGADGTDEWGSQVVTIGFEPSSDVGPGFPNVNITEFTQGILPFNDAFSNSGNINTFSPNQLNGGIADDGNIYASFLISGNTSNVPIANGTCETVFSFKLPVEYGSSSMTEMFLNETELSSETETQPTLNNSGTGLNEWNGTSSSSALPITLTRFTATKGERNVTLDWSTSSEVNGSHFDVQRSRDLESWTTIGTVDAVGESSTLQEYQLVDNDLPLSTRSSKRFYYRLNMVDNDGTAELSEVRTVRFDQDGAEFIVYPNPTQNEVFVNLSSITTESGPASMNVINMKGEKIKEVLLSTNDDISVDISNITAGVYYFIVNQGEETFTQKVVKID